MRPIDLRRLWELVNLVFPTYHRKKPIERIQKKTSPLKKGVPNKNKVKVRLTIQIEFVLGKGKINEFKQRGC